MVRVGLSTFALSLAVSLMGLVAQGASREPHRFLQELIERRGDSSMRDDAESFDSSKSTIDWAQPPVACVENIVPVLPDRRCLNLSQVVNPTSDWPSDLSETDRVYWSSVKGPLDYCRGIEVLRREAQAPGSFSKDAVELFWMQSIAPEHSAAKVAALYQASREQKMPVQILAGAVAQESIYAELGIAADGGNYSCGVGQINLQEWCRWANELPQATKATMGWPTEQVSCLDLSPKFVQPFYAIALRRLGGLPEYRLNTGHFADIAMKDVVHSFPAANESIQRLRFEAAQSFIQNCAEPGLGIRAKAHELAILFRQFIPVGLRERDQYIAGEHFQRKCQDTGARDAYPLHLGWLLAVGAYNAGPRAIDAAAYYQRWRAVDFNSVQAFENFAPQDLVESLYGAGRYSSHTDRIEFGLIDETPTSWLWLTQCILQRHIARVVQHVTLNDAAPLVHSLEDSNGCRASLFDAGGHLVTSGVPLARRTSPGRK